MKISAAIITFNEERNIARCIESVLRIADEIIVLDSFSSDKTQQICESYKVKFVQREWEGYAASKNYLNEICQHDYILSLDADEALDNEMIGEVEKLKSLESPQMYAVNRLTNYCGKWIKHSGWYPDIKTRLFPKEGSYWDGEFVHEELVTSEELETVLLKGHLEHFSYYSFKDHRERADKYSKLTAMKMNKQGKKASLLKPIMSAFVRFVSMYIFKAGFLDGKMGFKIAQISAQSNVFKYQELRRLNKLG